MPRSQIASKLKAKPFSNVSVRLWITLLLFGCLYTSCRKEAQESSIPYPDQAIVLSVEGMSCSTCKAKITRALSKVEGVEWAQIEYERGEVAYMGTATRPDVAKAIQSAGYEISEPDHLSEPRPDASNRDE